MFCRFQNLSLRAESFEFCSDDLSGSVKDALLIPAAGERRFIAGRLAYSFAASFTDGFPATGLAFSPFLLNLAPRQVSERFVKPVP